VPAIILQTGVGAVPTLTTGTSVELFQYSQFQHVPFHAQLRLAVVTTATGVLATIYAGTDLLMTEGPIQIKATSTFPTFPDDFHIMDDVAAGSRLYCNVRNTTGGTLVVILVAHIDPL
jgi:hypothetical protein